MDLPWRPCSEGLWLPPQPNDEAVIVLNEIGFGAVVFAHSVDDLPGNPEARGFDVAVVAEHFLDELVS